MARGYQLETYYDSLRAINRMIYSNQIKTFSSLISKLGLREADAYRLIIAAINDGVYQNLDRLYNKTYHASYEKPGVTKSSQAQDYMSPMELRLNAIAVRRATIAIDKLNGKRFSLRDVQDICYAEARSVAREFYYLKQGSGEFNMKLALPVASTKSIIKKYEHALVLGTLPKSKTFVGETNLEKEEKQRLIIANNKLFSIIKIRLIALGMTSMSMRQTAFARFNVEFYETDVARSHTLEISKILITDNAGDYVSNEELQINIEKLKIMKNSVDKIQTGTSFGHIYQSLEEAGKNARHIIVQKYKVLPELFSGFYHTYIDSDKRLLPQKENSQK